MKTKTIIDAALIVLCITLTHFVTRAPAVTSNFMEDAPRFYVLGKLENKYEMILLSEFDNLEKEYSFELDKDKITLNVGDIHTIEVIKKSKHNQRIKFHYSNTYISESIYDVTNNNVTPIRYTLISSVGDGIIYMFAFILAVFLIPMITHEIIFWLSLKNNKKI